MSERRAAAQLDRTIGQRAVCSDRCAGCMALIRERLAAERRERWRAHLGGPRWPARVPWGLVVAVATVGAFYVATLAQAALGRCP